MRLFLFAVAVVITAAFLLVDTIDRFLNRAAEPAPVSKAVLAFHDSLWIADFHNDALLWKRKLAVRTTRGHVDLPRLRAGGYELAVFSVPTAYHVFSNYRRTPALGDVMVFDAIASRWPAESWFDPYRRARVMANKLREGERESRGGLRVVLSREDLVSLAAAQARGDSVIGALLSLEGMHLAGRDVAHVDSLFAAGFRVFGIAHMSDNDVGGSAHGWRKGGLSEFGRRVVARIDSLGGIIDLAHASRATIDDVLAMTSRPVVVSHTGLTSNCPGPRNLPDEVVTRVASRDGMIAIGFWKAAVCGNDAEAIARAIRRAIEVAGVDHVALGSDFDGAVRTPFDAAHIASLTSALLDAGLTRAQIRAVMGENQKRFLLAALPSAH